MPLHSTPIASHRSKPAIPRTISTNSFAKKQQLLEHLNKDLKKPDDRDVKVHNLSTFSVFTFRLPPMRGRSREFMQYFLNRVLDNNIDMDLTDARVLNWWMPYLKKIFPVSTVGDGNCLLHAVSQYMWGCHDHSNFLRRLVYVVLAGDQPDELRERWQRQQKYQDECATRLEIHLTSMQWTSQWEDIVKNAEDRTQSTNVNASAFECLEGIHIFALANILRRPIVVLSKTVINDFEGQPIDYNHLGGIYLPLLWKPSDCVRTPIVLAYHCNHFVPMLSMVDLPDVDITNETGKHGVPLVSSDLKQLPLHFLKEIEERESANLLTLYLEVFEKNMLIQQNSVPVLFAKLHFHDIDPEFNMLDDYMDEMHSAYLYQQGAEQTHIIPNMNGFYSPAGAPIEPSAPFQSLLSEMSGFSIHTVPQQTPTAPIPPQTTRPEEGRSAAAASPVFPSPPITTSYPPRQSQNRTPYQANRNSSATYPPRTEYRDVSISGEECRTPNCSFYSSLETYPYCHDCNRKLNTMRKSQQLPGMIKEEDTEHPLRDLGRSLNDEVFSERPSRMHDQFDRQRSLSCEEEEVNDLPQHNDDEQPFSIPYTANIISCTQENCTKRGKSVCEGRCHEHYRDIGSQDLRRLFGGESRPRSRTHFDYISPRPSNDRVGHRIERSNSEIANQMTVSAVETRTREETPANVPPGTRSLGNVNTPVAAATYPAASRPAKIGRSLGRIPGEIMEPTSMREPVKCKNTGCPMPGYTFTEGFCQRCFNAISMAKAQMAPKPRQEHIGFPPTPRLPCRTPNCLIYAQPDLEGYCALCFRKLFDMDTSSVSSISSSSTPEPSRQFTEETLAFANGPRAEKCLVPGCDRYGDPVFQGLCKRCLDLQKQTRWTGLQHAPERPTGSRPVSTERSNVENTVQKGYETAVKEIEKACKTATGRCKNTRCQNYGNKSSHGYCNGCYQSMR